MVIDPQFARAYNMTRAAALQIVNMDPPFTISCFWCGKEEGHFHDCAFFIANRVIHLTNSKE
jgi:hypothetical protein